MSGITGAMLSFEPPCVRQRSLSRPALGVPHRSLATSQGHFSAVTDLALAPGNWSLLSAARDSVVIMWDLRTFAKLAPFPSTKFSKVSSPLSLCRESKPCNSLTRLEPWCCGHLAALEMLSVAADTFCAAVLCCLIMPCHYATVIDR